MRVGVPKEVAANERRVALVPDAVVRLMKGGGFEVVVERGAGASAACPDEAYKAAGATIADRAAVLGQADVVLQVQAPSAADVALYREGGALIALLQPGSDAALIQQLARRKLTTFSLLLLPRITRAQPMDVLSSQATVAGYKAVLLAASATGRFLPMLVTAAGTLPAARVLVLGAGVAGLQAIATARRLGAIVSAFDVRPAVKEQVQSLGAVFLEMAIEEHAETAGGYAKQLSEETHRKELAFLAAAVKDADIVITTAAIPGKRAPLLITAAAVQGMKPGAVIVDLAAETGGNCELTEPGTEIVRNGVVILGPVNLPSTLPLHASQMYARNLSAFLGHVVQDGRLRLDFEDPIISDTCVTHAGEVRKT
jgi:NAD(P) transhydrogenase subunit alpha